ncbi:MAG: S-layer homology domain-containing protein [Clostridia bacterium]|nr:S-layer homology domain-containing protein [Clostridia bacterium]
MKKLLALLLMFTLLCSLPFTALAEEPDEIPKTEETAKIFELIPPGKWIYTVGEEPNYAEGEILYLEDGHSIPLSDENCHGLDTSTPGNKTVTVTVEEGTATFRVTVLSTDEPITQMTDITPKHWAYQYFGPCMKAGFFQGDLHSEIQPDTPITRAQMATLIYRAWQTDPTVMVTDHPQAAEPFPDVAEDLWYFEAVEACRKAGLLRGMEDGSCQPEANISRQDAILMLMRIQYTDEELDALDIEKTIEESGVKVNDFDLVAEYAQSAVAASLGSIISGDEKGNINPTQSISRAECAAIFKRLFLLAYEWDSPAPLIYLSPSNQFTNPYTGVATNEGDEMTKVAEAVKDLLEQEGYEVYIASGTSKIRERTVEANEMGADVYVPIHSNAGGGVGTRVFYRGDREGSVKLARYLFDSLAAVTNTPFSTNYYKEDYVCLLPDGAPFHEVAAPNMPVAYLEVEFHDIPEKALWITQNTDALARAIADGIIAYCENDLNQTEDIEIEDPNQENPS